MPPITRLFIKTALVYFVAAMTLALVMSAGAIFDLPLFVRAMNPVYFHLFMIGWVTQLIIGVGYWMFPRFSRAQPRGSIALAWATYILLNGGLLLRFFAEPAQVAQPALLWGTLLVLSAILQWLGGMAFIANTWPRIKER